MWNKDEIKGKGKKFKGQVKDKVGEMTGNRDLEAEGEAERIEGEAQETLGQARRKADEFAERVKDTLRDERKERE